VKWGSISAQRLESERSKVLLSPFHSQPRPSGVSLVFSVLENIPQVLANPFKAAQNQDARKSVSPTLLVLK